MAHGPRPLSLRTPCSRRPRPRARAQWIVEARTPSIDCAALRLREIGRNHTLTLLTPFDRPVALERDESRALSDRAAGSTTSSGRCCPCTPSARFAPRQRWLSASCPYQLEPALLVAREGVSRVLIADGVGLGKTIQAGLILRELAERDESCRALVLSPAGLRDQWRTELSARLGLHAVVADAGWLRSSSAERPAARQSVVDAGHLCGVTRSRQAARSAPSDRGRHLGRRRHRRGPRRHIRNRPPGGPPRHRRRSRHVILLTATPHEGDAGERHALCRIGQIEKPTSHSCGFSAHVSRSEGAPPANTRTGSRAVAGGAADARPARPL